MLQRGKDIRNWIFWVAGLIIIIWVLPPVLGEAEETPLSLQEVESIIPLVEAAEGSIRNIKVDAESWLEERASKSDPWQRTPTYFSCTAWMDGRPRGKLRVDVHKQNLKWVNGVAPYGWSSYSLSFDGTNTRTVEYASGHSGKTFTHKSGQVLPGASERLTGNMMGSCTGKRFTTNFFFDGEGQGMVSFSQIFRAQLLPEAAESKLRFDFAYEQKDGVLCLKFGTRPAKWGRQTWWFDPNRGFALLAYLHTSIGKDGTEHIVSDIRVSRVEEVAAGVWWPMEATTESEIRDPKLLQYVQGDPNAPYKRTVYKALKVIANDPSFSESIFTVPFPEGYLIDDKVAGRKYRVGEDPNAKG
jgi:hypothetical protein